MNKTVIHNPVLWSDVPDPDVIRVGHTYYMVSTSMHTMPGCPIMKSEDLLHWELVNYVFDTLEDHEGHNLTDGIGIYGKGSWAASLRYHQGTYYVCFSSNDQNRFYIYSTLDIEKGPWVRSVVDGLLHDPALLFDEDRVYVISGNGEITITELNEDVTGIKEGGLQQLLLETEREGFGLRCEGCHAYKLNGYYYLFFIDWPSTHNRRRRQVCYRSTELLGPYEFKVLLDDDMGYFNNGVAQGGIFDTPEGDWFTMLFQDHAAVGRIPVLQPLSWVEDWPVIGDNGKALERVEAPLRMKPTSPLVISDEFDYLENQLALHWQWNHNPDNERWSLTARPGYMRLETAGITDHVLYARNTLTQRTEGPGCRCETVMELSNMKAGDHAGLIALQYFFGTVGVRAHGDGRYDVVMSRNRGDGSEEIVEQIEYGGTVIHLKMEFNFINNADLAVFSYSSDGMEWFSIGSPLSLRYTLEHFMGCRMGLYNYATLQTGGYVDVDYFRYDRLD